jgi:hypothetical protein
LVRCAGLAARQAIPKVGFDRIAGAPHQSIHLALATAVLVVIAWGSAAFIAGAWRTKTREGPRLLSTPATALVSSVANIRNTSGVAAVTGHPTLRISLSPVHGTAGVFVGIGHEG